MSIFGTSPEVQLPALSTAEIESAKRLHEHVTVLASEIGARSLTCAPENLELAAAYIEHQFKKSKCSVSTHKFEVSLLTNKDAQFRNGTIVFPSANLHTRNVIAEVKGHARAEEIVIVGAHYDSVYGCPAANDNGSGVAALLELAGYFGEKKLDRTLRLVAFTNEEPPFFHTDAMGSYRYAGLCKERNENIIAMLSLETIGYYSDEKGSQKYPHPLFKCFCPNKGNFLLFLSNLKSRALLNRSLQSFRSGVQFPARGIALPEFISGVRFSDQDSFWKYGYPALMVTDTANYRYPYYHENEDTPDKLDFKMLARVVTGLTKVVEQLCQK